MNHTPLPYAEPSSLEDVYDDARLLALRYPVTRLPQQALIDRLSHETRWQQLCEEISTHGALTRPYLD
ncbi:MAG: hypothetical protein ABJA81_13645 [Nocardioidaceae bacterium]